MRHVRNEEYRIPLRGRATHNHGHGLGCRRSFIQQRCVGDVHARQLGDQGLVVEQRFQPSLCNFSLVRRVRRIPDWIFQKVALDCAGGDGAMVPLPHEILNFDVLRHDFSQLFQSCSFRNRLLVQRHLICTSQVLGNDSINQLINRIETHLLYHFLLLLRTCAQMTRNVSVAARKQVVSVHSVVIVIGVRRRLGQLDRSAQHLPLSIRGGSESTCHCKLLAARRVAQQWY
mmetsp:Transcript_25937/g.57236  ORF Transcript_25937/g.57236 Transcript_25937/m.57236 type:complete len:230 (+) Transcript_25937:2599-3288(+)